MNTVHAASGDLGSDPGRNELAAALYLVAAAAGCDMANRHQCEALSGALVLTGADLIIAIGRGDPAISRRACQALMERWRASAALLVRRGDRPEILIDLIEANNPGWITGYRIATCLGSALLVPARSDCPLYTLGPDGLTSEERPPCCSGQAVNPLPECRAGSGEQEQEDKSGSGTNFGTTRKRKCPS